MRKCGNCGVYLPPETKHIYSEMDEVAFCIDCVTVTDYTETAFHVGGTYIGDTAQENCGIIEDYEDEYEVDEE